MMITRDNSRPVWHIVFKISRIALAVSCIALFVSCAGGEKKFDATGTFEATEVTVSSEAAGKILSLTADEGAILQANEEVGKIDSVQLELKRKQLLASIKALDVRRPDVDVQIAATREQLETARKERARLASLLQSDAANRKQLDDADAQIATFQKQLEAQRSSLETNNRGITEDSSALEIQVAQLDDQIARSSVVSPIAGTVTAKYAEKGELASVGRALFKLADLDHMYLRAYLSGEELSQVKVGDSVTVMSEFGKDDYRSYEGTVTWISAKAEFTPKTIQTRDERSNLSYAVKIAVKNDGLLKIGMYGGVLLKS